MSPERVVVRERYQGATTIYGDLSCPLGPAVRGTVLPGAEGRLCFTFVAKQCEYTRFQDGSAIHNQELANASVPRMCIALASVDEAQRLAALVNMGPRQARPASPAPSEEPRSGIASGVPPNQTEATPGPRQTPSPPAREGQSASGSTRSAPERVHAYSSPGSAGGARADSARQQIAGGVPLALFIHVRSREQRAEIERLVEPLSARGIRVTGIKLMDAGPADTDLRYFYAEDARRTAEVVRVLRGVGLPLPRIKHIRGFEARATPRQYELWLSPTDWPNEISARRAPRRGRETM